ncbi:RICIN domain-containing protein [Nonomuraea sediminis]|uniref:RICIN domain-containing protein n=1 Tax=Nonomuraea sediminis TaxID=2835864 RepID=UPI001BDC1A41|nr:RICIN domain-containing protein [Nonomuraea sediminis]
MKRTLTGMAAGLAVLSMLLVAAPAPAMAMSGWGAKVGNALVEVFKAIMKLVEQSKEGHEERSQFTQDVAREAWQDLGGEANVLVFLESERRQNNYPRDRHCDQPKSLSGDYDHRYEGSLLNGADFNDDDRNGTYVEFMDEKSSGSAYAKAMCYRLVISDEGGDFNYYHDGGYVNWAYIPAKGTQADRHDGNGAVRVTFHPSPAKAEHDQGDQPRDPGGAAPAHGKRITLHGGGRELSNLTVWDKGGGFWEIEPTATGKVFEVVPNRWNVQYGAVNHGAAQLWRFREIGGGRYQIVNRYNTEHGYPQGGCLTVNGDGSLWALDCNQPDKQTWTLS